MHIAKYIELTLRIIYCVLTSDSFSLLQTLLFRLSNIKVTEFVVKLDNNNNNSTSLSQTT